MKPLDDFNCRLIEAFLMLSGGFFYAKGFHDRVRLWQNISQALWEEILECFVISKKVYIFNR